VQLIIDKSLDRKLTPVINMLADAVDPGPRLSDVVGGIGYIFGLVGVALYFSTRRKEKEK
jgi:nickel transport protein